MKSEIIQELGQTDLVLPARINDGLAARARQPGGADFNLVEECRAAGIDAAAMEALVNQASLASDGRIVAPGLDGLRAAIWDDVATMADAVKTGDTARGERTFERLAALQRSLPVEAGDSIDPAQIARLTAVSGAGYQMAKKSKRRAWTKADIRTLKTLAKTKTHASRIARALKRTEGATRQRAFSMGLSLDSR
jgi:hypothetical protein